MSTFLVLTQFLTKKMTEVKIAFHLDMPLTFQFLAQIVWTLKPSVRVYSRLQICILPLGKILSLCRVISKTNLLQNFCPSQYVLFVYYFACRYYWLNYILKAWAFSCCKPSQHITWYISQKINIILFGQSCTKIMLVWAQNEYLSSNLGFNPWACAT